MRTSLKPKPFILNLIPTISTVDDEDDEVEDDTQQEHSSTIQIFFDLRNE